MAMSAEPVREERGWWGLVLGLVLFALVLTAVRARLEPPAPKGTDAPAAEFSGARAVELLRTLARDGRPHPAGSPANERIRETIVAELRRLGYEPTVQEGMACTPGGTCALLRNVVARQESQDGQAGRAVLLMAHYDSVQAGPGVGDDLSGVATVLETARALKAGSAPERPMIFLLTDGEELGLLGARLFVDRHPWAAEVEAVVNLEARGTSGPSLMFETIGDDALLVGRYAAAAPRPITSSLYATIYEALPNDTDLSVFKNHEDRRYHGLNFAFIRSPAHYHTSEDSVENLSPASLQHHGDNALAAMRALSAGSSSLAQGSDAVFFDILGFGVVRWPKGWTLAIAILALVLVLAASLRRRDRSGGQRRGVLFGLLGFLAAIVATALLAVGLSMLIQGATPGLWVHGPQAEIAAFWLLGLAVVAALSAAVSRRAGSEGLWAGVWIAWSVLGAALAIVAPGISYLFLAPALIAGIVGLVFRAGRVAACLIPAGVAALLWMPILLPLYDGLGKPALVVIGVLAAAMFTTLAPLVPGSGSLGRRLLPAAAFLLALVCAGVAFATAPYSEETPQAVSIQHYQEAGSTEARWLVRGNRPLPSALKQAAKLGEAPETAYPWGRPNHRAFQAPAPRLEVPAPQVSVLEDSVAGGKRRLRLLLTSNRQAPNAGIFLPPEAGLESARVEGQEVPLRGSRGTGGNREGWTELAMATMRPEGVEMEVVLGAVQPLEWYVYDRSPGLPPAGEPLLQARPPAAVTFGSGDTTLVARKMRI